MNRRELLKLSAGLIFSSTVKTVVATPPKPGAIKVIVIGAGQGGLSVARHLIEKNVNVEISMYDSNLKSIPGKIKAVEGIKLSDYETIVSAASVSIKNQPIDRIDPINRIVIQPAGAKEYYDYLILSPGVSYNTEKVIGFSSSELKTDPAWINPQNELFLFKKLKTMQNGGVAVISAPPLPFRYPIGVYQRATRIADFLAKKKSRSKLLILDEKETFPFQKDYLDYWKKELPDGMVEWVPASLGGEVIRFSEKHNILITKSGKISADFLNYIPPQQAGNIAFKNELTDQSGWCPVNKTTMESELCSDLYIIGDANNITDEHKTAKQAMIQGELAAKAIIDKIG